MAIVKVMLKKHRQLADGTFPVVVYVYEIKPQYIYTGYHVRDDQFKEGRVIKHPDGAIINAKVEDLRIKIRDSVLPGVGYVKGARTPGAKASFSDYLRKRSKQYREAGQIYTVYKVDRMIREIIEYHHRDVAFAEINSDWIRGFAAMCHRIPNSQNTVMKKIKDMRVLYGQAIAEAVVHPPNPFDAYKLSFTPVLKEKLTAEQIVAIEQVHLEEGSSLWHTRNAFLLSFYAQGMRFQNVCLLRRSDIRGDRLLYQMNKGRKWRELHIHQKLKAVLDRYPPNREFVFPWVEICPSGVKETKRAIGSANAQVNADLKIIAKLSGIACNLTFHMARHTFAYLAKSRNVSTDVIKDALGHSDTKITEAYLKSLSDDHINEAVSVVWE